MNPLDLSSLCKALDSLKGAIESVSDEKFMNSLTSHQLRTMKAGVIQNFEFSYEASWKMLKRQLISQEGTADINLLNRKDLFRIGAQKGFIDDPAAWFVFHKARNETSHTYDEHKAEEVYQIAKTFLPSAQYLLSTLEGRHQ